MTELDIVPDEIPTIEDTTYLITPAAVLAEGGGSTGMDESLVVFCIDTSGSMCVTTEVKRELIYILLTSLTLPLSFTFSLSLSLSPLPPSLSSLRFLVIMIFVVLRKSMKNSYRVYRQILQLIYVNQNIDFCVDRET